MDKKTIEEKCVELLLAKGLTLTTSESCTGGLVASRIVDVAGASGTLMQGFVTYSNEAKETYLGVKHETLEEFGAVSSETAEEMALGCVFKAGTDVGIATTGIAGPGGGSPQKPVGLVYIACCIKPEVKVRELRLSGSRREIRNQAANAVLELLFEMLSGD
ncbi:MAG: CinA family protein [Lachnospiraceae bacterium]|nr:CinA family protein [Lachnospiraceae bacterium]